MIDVRKHENVQIWKSTGRSPLNEEMKKAGALDIIELGEGQEDGCSVSVYDIVRELE